MLNVDLLFAFTTHWKSSEAFGSELQMLTFWWPTSFKFAISLSKPFQHVKSNNETRTGHIKIRAIAHICKDQWCTLRETISRCVRPIKLELSLLRKVTMSRFLQASSFRYFSFEISIDLNFLYEPFWSCEYQHLQWSSLGEFRPVLPCSVQSKMQSLPLGEFPTDCEVKI